MGSPWCSPTAGTSAIETGEVLLRRLTFLGGLLLLPGTLSGTDSGQAPWEHLERMRRQVTVPGVLGAPFRQRWIPSGSEPASADEERGVLLVRLPECVRFQYQTPFDRNYQIERRRVRSWTEGSPFGDELELSEEHAWLTELWLAPVSDLRRRFRLKLLQPKPIRLEISAIVQDAGPTSIELELDSQWLPRRLSWADAEGNRTELILGAWQPAIAEDPCRVPSGIEWRVSSRG